MSGILFAAVDFFDLLDLAFSDESDSEAITTLSEQLGSALAPVAGVLLLLGLVAVRCPVGSCRHSWASWIPINLLWRCARAPQQCVLAFGSVLWDGAYSGYLLCRPKSSR